MGDAKKLILYKIFNLGIINKININNKDRVNINNQYIKMYIKTNKDKQSVFCFLHC